MNHRIYNLVYQSPWLIDGGAWMSIHHALQDRHQTPLSESIPLTSLFIQRKKMEIDVNGIAHVSVFGVLGHLSEAEKQCGGTDYGDLSSELVAAGSEARGLMIHADSPGGMAIGCAEVSQIAASLKIPKAAYVEGMACSACYFLASSAGKITASASSIVGSIGAIIPYVDRSAQWEKEGLKADYITSGPLKAAGYPPSMTEAQRASLQENVNDMFAQFRDHVLAYRKIAPEAMQGQSFLAPRAKANNLVDEVGTFEDAYDALLKKVRR